MPDQSPQSDDLLVALLTRELVNRGWLMRGEFFVDADGSEVSMWAATRRQATRELEDGYRPFQEPGERGLSKDPDLEDPAVALARRAMERAIKPAMRKEFRDEKLMPNVTVVVAAPPEGKIGLGSTEPDAGSIMQALVAAQGMVRRSIRLQAGRQ